MDNSPQTIQVAVAEPNRLGESPLWHPTEQVLYWCDIPAFRLHRLDPATGATRFWQLETDVACCAPMQGGGLLLAMRDGLWRFDPHTGERTLLAPPPYDPSQERFNDGKCDPQGRFWVGTIYEPRDPPLAHLYCYSQGQLIKREGGITTSNGLAWSPHGRTLYWSDTKAHTVYTLDFDPPTGATSQRRVFATFPVKQTSQALADYGGRPDGAAMDAEGCYWVALFEGQRLLRLSPQGQVLREVRLPVRCPTMPCFGGADLKTLYITTAREGRPAEELAEQPHAGCVLSLRVDVAGQPANVFIE
ncbi:MAG: SMP-30/gluconolactonase/LRE family protein [Burkholderiales bacterium]